MNFGVLDPHMVEKPEDIQPIGDSSIAEIRQTAPLPKSSLFDLNRLQIALGHYRSMSDGRYANVGLLVTEDETQPATVLGIWPEDGTTAVVVCDRHRAVNEPEGEA